MSDGMSTGLGKGLGARAHERADDEKTTLDQAERWATLLGAQLAAPRAQVSASEPANGWRAGAGDMTPGGANAMPAQSAAAGAAEGSGQAAADPENRMIVRVDGGDLGEVALCVDRKDGAIRVTISAQDAAAELALGLERSGLVHALESHGITVDSVTVVRAANFGTLPAQRLGATQRNRESAEATHTDDDRARRRSSRKLNLIG